MLPAFLEGSYREWAKRQDRHVQAAAKDEFWKQLTKFGFVADRTGRSRYRSVPGAEDMRSKIEERLGGDSDDSDDGEFSTSPENGG